MNLERQRRQNGEKAGTLSKDLMSWASLGGEFFCLHPSLMCLSVRPCAAAVEAHVACDNAMRPLVVCPVNTNYRHGGDWTSPYPRKHGPSVENFPCLLLVDGRS